MIAIDTNLLVYAHRSAVREHSAARKALEQAARNEEGWGFALPSIGEFWSVVTHPASTGRPSSPEEATAYLQALGDAGARLWTPSDGFADRLVRRAREAGLTGRRIFDLQIALLCFENGAREIWTHDRNFFELPGLRRIDPLS